MKKLFIVFACIAVALSCFSLTACGVDEHYSETFVAKISESSYASKNSAASAFINEELNGELKTYDFIRYESKGAASSGFISAAKLESADSVDCGKVYFGDESGKNSSVTMYIAEYGNRYRYVAPLPAKGEPISKSYYQSVMSAANYLNCSVDTTYSFRFLSINSLYRQTLQFDNDKAYFKQDFPGAMRVDFYVSENHGDFEYYCKDATYGDGVTYYTREQLSRLYSENGYEFLGYEITKGGYEKLLDDFADISELLEFIFAADTDCSYFIKTDFGFEVTQDSFMRLVEDTIGDLGEEFEIFKNGWNEHRAYINVAYYVSDGRLSREQFNLTAIGDDGVMAVSTESKFTDFGTTHITLPTRA